MFKFVFVILFSLFTVTSHAQSMRNLIDNFKEKMMSICPPAANQTSVEVLKLNAEWAEIQKAAGYTQTVDFVVSDCTAEYGFVVPDSNAKSTVVVSSHLVRFPQNVRQFVMAHELGHAATNNWVSLIGTAVSSSEQGIVSVKAAFTQLLETAAKASHQEEFLADAYASTVLSKMGVSGSHALEGLFSILGTQPESASHPSSQARVKALQP